MIDLPSFYSSSDSHDSQNGATADVVRLLNKLKAEQVRGVVLDLRQNGGGSLQEAISLTGLFIRKGPVVQTRDSKGAVRVEMDRDPSVVYDGPLVVLTSRFSASASEIVAGALQDYGRAVIVGDTATFGKGTVQTIVPLADIMDRAGFGHAYDPGALKVTIDKFYRPSGASTELRGVTSDIVLPSQQRGGRRQRGQAGRSPALGHRPGRALRSRGSGDALSRPRCASRRPGASPLMPRSRCCARRSPN